MKYAVDRIENNIAILENIEDKNIIEISLDLLPNGVKEKDILKLENENYVLDNDEKEERLRRIKEKMERLKNRN
jgi:hypothetical protein